MTRVHRRPGLTQMLLGVIGFCGLLLADGVPAASAKTVVKRPNVLWIYVEDMSPWIGCYGDKINAGQTPKMDKLASDGVRFSQCYVPAPVCSSCRSGIIVGAMQTTTGTHNHRSSRDSASAIHLPQGIKTLPEIFRAAGYYTFNAGKEDYNFVYDRSQLYSQGSRKGRAPWRGRADGQPFFGQIQLKGGKTSTNSLKQKVTPEDVTVPPYFPDHAIFRKWWAHHYDCVRVTDAVLGDILSDLEQDGLLDTTFVIFFSDHGFNHSVRHKQFCYEGGVHVPLIISGPDTRLKAGSARDDLVSGLDISATTLALAGFPLPKYVEGQDLFAANFQPREFVVSARDRCDYTIDRTRTIRTRTFRYLRNYLTDRPLLQAQYRDGKDYVQFLRQGHREGTLPADVDRIFFGKRPAEELYDLENDPYEMRNLVGDPKFADPLQRHRKLLADWIKQTDDKGQYPESDAGLRAVLRRWKGKCVNPEYDRVRTAGK